MHRVGRVILWLSVASVLVGMLCLLASCGTLIGGIAAGIEGTEGAAEAGGEATGVLWILSFLGIGFGIVGLIAGAIIKAFASSSE